MIEVKHLTKEYDGFAAVEDLSFVIEDGMIYGFLGPNGAGKTTTMNIMTGYLSPTDGEVIVNGHDILSEPEEAKKTIGYLPETPPLYGDLTVLEYLRFTAELKRIPKAERKARVDTVIAQMGLEEVSGRLIRNLSKGFRQRIGLAQALIADPQTLILDEPTVGLDPKQVIEIRELIRALGKTHTVILSSHILSEVSEVCDRVLILSEGRLAAFDTPEKLKESVGSGMIIYVTALGSEEQVTDALRKVAEIEDSSVSDDGVHVRVRAAESGDIRGEISKALFEAGCSVVELRAKETGLEEIFLHLTGQDGEDKDGTPDEKGGRT